MTSEELEKLRADLADLDARRARDHDDPVRLANPLVASAQRGNVKERFGERIRRLRTEQKLGLREFATKVGISPTYLSRIETSEEKAPPAEEVIRKMATQLSDSFDELMTLAGRVSEESLNVIKADAGMPEFLRTVGERKLSAEDLMKLLPSEPMFDEATVRKLLAALDEATKRAEAARRMLDRMADESHVFNTILENTQRERDDARAQLAALHAAASAFAFAVHGGKPQSTKSLTLDRVLAGLASVAEHERRVRADESATPSATAKEETSIPRLSEDEGEGDW